MSILNGFKKYKNYKTDANGDHQLQSYWTSTDTVVDVDGNTLTSILANLPNPMVMRGTVGAQADNPTITALPVDGSADEGDTYKVITDGTYTTVAAKVGDVFTCTSKTVSANTWCHIPAGDESIVIANPTGTATDELATVSIDGVIYEVTDADYRNTDHTFTMNTYSSYSHTFENTQISQRMPVRNVFTAIQSLFNSVKTAINDHGSLFGDIATALTNKVSKDNATYKSLSYSSTTHEIDDSMELTTQFDGAGETGCVQITNTNLGVVTDAVNDHAEWIAKETAGSKTVTGNPLAITDASPNKAEKIEIGFEPQQDKHGYNSVWVGGAGKNKLNATVRTQTSRSVQYTMAANNFLTVNGTATGNSDYEFLLDSPINLKSGDTIYFQLLNFSGSVGSNIGVFLNNYEKLIGYLDINNSMTIQYTCEEDVQITYFIYRHYLSNVANDYTANVSLSIGESLSQFYPYENICPIQGYDIVSVDRCGKNLWNRDTLRRGVYTYINGTETQSTAAYNISSQKIRVKPNTAYSAGIYGTSYTNGSLFAIYYDVNGNALNTGAYVAVNNNLVDGTPTSFITDANTHFIVISGYRSGGTDILLTANFLLCEGLQTAYIPFTGDNVSLQLGQTIYGGKLTILQDGSADVDVDTAYNEYDGSSDEDWHFENAAAGKNFWIPEPIFKKPCYGNDLICNMALSTSSAGTEKDKVFVSNGGNLNVTFGDTLNINTAADFKTWLASHVLQVAGTIATPFTLHLSPVETLTLLQGINNVWTDGTTLSLTYQPDNAIGQAKGTAQDAMQMALDANVYTDTQLTNYALKSSVYKSAVSDSKSSWTAGEGWLADTIGPETKGVYVFIGWAEFDGSLGGRRGIKLARHNSSSTVMASAFTSESADSGYPRTVTCVEYVTCGTDAAVSLAWRRLRLYTANNLSSGTIKGGVIMIKISDL